MSASATVCFETFLSEVDEHYRNRSFPESARFELCQFVRRAWVPDSQHLNFAKASPLFSKGSPFPLDQLTRFTEQTVLDLICRRPCSRVDLGKADATFAFSFGYRIPLTDRIPGPSELDDNPSLPNRPKRLPGPNNEGLARIARDLKDVTAKPLLAQFEIGDALRPLNCPADYTAPREDMGTDKAITYFLSNMNQTCNWELDTATKPKVLGRRTVTVVAHRHQVGRCLVLLSDRNLECLVPSCEYIEYDTACEAQWRVRNPEIYICSDFVSMCAWMCPR